VLRFGQITSVLATATCFRFFTNDFAPSCFRSASGRYDNARSAPRGALQVTDNTIFFGCGSSTWTLFRKNDKCEDRPIKKDGGKALVSKVFWTDIWAAKFGN